MNIIVKTKNRIKAIIFFTATFTITSLIIHYLLKIEEEKISNENSKIISYEKEEKEFISFFKKEKNLRKRFIPNKIKINYIKNNDIYFDYIKSYPKLDCKEKEYTYLNRKEKIYIEIKLIKDDKNYCNYLFKDNNI